MFDFVRNVEIWEDGRLVLLESFQSQDKLVGGVADITLQIYWSPVTIIHTSQCVILKYLDIFLNPWQGRNKNDVHWQGWDKAPAELCRNCIGGFLHNKQIYLYLQWLALYNITIQLYSDKKDDKDDLMWLEIETDLRWVVVVVGVEGENRDSLALVNSLLKFLQLQLPP